MPIPYSVLATECCYTAIPTRHTTAADRTACEGVAVCRLTAADSTHREVCLLCTQQLAGSSDETAVVTADAQCKLAHCHRLEPGHSKLTAPQTQSAVLNSSSITLQGLADGAATCSGRWQGIAVRARPISTPWQLQAAFPVPLLLQAWPQHQLCGAFTAAVVLVDASQLGTQQNTGQLQQLQQHLMKPCPPEAAAAAGTACMGAHSSKGGSACDVLQLLSAAAAALVAATAGGPDSTHHQHCSAACAAAAEPTRCSSALYAALCSTLQQQGSGGSTAPSAHQPAGSQPAALICAATSTGQVWVCDPLQAVQQLQQAAGLNQQQLHKPQQQQQQQQQPSGQHAIKLLLDLQQRVVAALPVSVGRGGTAGLLLVGSLGRLVLLQTQHTQQHRQVVAALTAHLQLQLSFQVAAAAVIAAPLSSSSSQQSTHQQALEGQLSSQALPPLLLLLLSTSGRLYAASLDAVISGTQPAAAVGAQQPGAAAAAAEPELLPVQPVHIPLPAPVSRLWTVWQPPTGTGKGDASSSVVLQLAGSAQLLEVAAHDMRAAVAAAGATAAAAQPGAAAQARQQLEELMSALEAVAAAWQLLEQAAAQQDGYLRGMQQDLALLGLLQQQYGSTPSSTAAAAAANQQQLQRQARAGLAAGTGAPGSSSRGNAAPTLRCSIHLHGLWPVLGAAGVANPSSSIHMAVSVHLQPQAAGSSGASSGNSNSSAGRGFSWQLGPGWQLVVTFVPEFADSSSVQTTVDLTSSSSGGGGGGSSIGPDGTLQASLLLPLPEGCGALQQGGWVMVYAVKQPTGPAPATAAGGSVAAVSQAQPLLLLPVVTLLGHQYVSVLQLSAMAAVNPAVQPLVSTGGALLQQQALVAGSSSSSGNTAPATYSCNMQLSAAAGVARDGPGGGAAATSAAPQGTGGGGVKRPRSGTAAAAAAGAGAASTAQQGAQQEGHAAGQGPEQASSTQGSGAEVQALQGWLQKALCLDSGPTAAPQLPGVQPGWSSGAAAGFAGHGSNLGAGVLGTSRGVPAGVLGDNAGQQGQVLFRLGAGQQGRAAWGLSTGQEPPSAQLLRAAAAGAGGVLAGTKRPAAAVAGGGSDGGVALSLQLQAGQVPALASMHRAVLLDVLQQLEGPAGAGSGDSSSGSGGGGWHVEASVLSLQLALSRLRQLHGHLLKLQDTADQAQELMHNLQPPTAAAAAAAGGLQEDTAVSEQVAQLKELAGLSARLEAGLHAAYGRFLLAVGDAATFGVAVA